MAILSRLWRGQIALEAAFWHWAVLGGVLVNLATSALFVALIATDLPILALIAGYAPSLPYNVLVTVAVWRAAERYPGDRKWADLARGVTAAGMVLLSVT